MNVSSRSVLQHLGHELKRFALMFLYLWALFLLFVLDEDVILHARRNRGRLRRRT
jgi:hypothetical protein